LDIQRGARRLRWKNDLHPLLEVERASFTVGSVSAVS